MMVLLALQITASGAQFPELAVRELAALQSGVTAAAWLAVHPGDAVTSFRRDSVRRGAGDDRWCARASRVDRLPDGTQTVRYAYFYPPEAPVSLALPAAESPTLIREQCLLGTIWLEAPTPDSASGSAVAGRTRDALSQRHGPVTPSPDAWFGRTPTDSQRRALSRLAGAEALSLGLHFFGAAAWRVPGRWQADPAVVVSAYDAGFGAPAARRVLAFAYLPIAGVASFRGSADRTETLEHHAAVLVEQAARLSGLDRVRTDRLTQLLAAAESAFTGRHPASPRAIDSSAVVALADWLSSARRLAPRERAAALLAADQVAGSHAMAYVRAQRQDSGRLALERLGAVYAYDQLGASYNYTHNWLDEALRLDRDGPVETLATVALLRVGFNETGMCGGGSEAFRQVIATGERLLGGRLDTATAAEVHRLVGDAYADIVALATGDGAGYADSTVYLAEAPAARRSAIDHYRKALALDHVSPEAREPWLEAWRLLAGLPPTTTHFFCVYD